MADSYPEANPWRDSGEAEAPGEQAAGGSEQGGETAQTSGPVVPRADADADEERQYELREEGAPENVREGAVVPESARRDAPLPPCSLPAPTDVGREPDEHGFHERGTLDPEEGRVLDRDEAVRRATENYHGRQWPEQRQGDTGE